MRSSRTSGPMVAAAARIAAVLLAAAPLARAQSGTAGAGEDAHARDESAATPPPARDPAEGALSEARRALERATRLRSAGDE
ncbi:MAG: hypothetical protein M3O50_14485, partial [Myxococcota bacterium]|nr:hypothetical protein [Myxococcota bacterium]